MLSPFEEEERCSPERRRDQDSVRSQVAEPEEDSFGYRSLLALSAEYWATALSFLTGPAFREWARGRAWGRTGPGSRALACVPAMCRWDRAPVPVLKAKHPCPLPPALHFKSLSPGQFVNNKNEPIQLGCSFLMFCTWSTSPARTTGTMSTAPDG